jgi:hypothetical protein
MGNTVQDFQFRMFDIYLAEIGSRNCSMTLSSVVKGNGNSAQDGVADQGSRCPNVRPMQLRN